MGFKFRKVIACQVCQIDYFQIAPDPFSRVEFRRITRKLFEMNTPGRSSSKIGPDRLRAVNWATVPNHQKRASDQAQKLFQERNHLTTGDCVMIRSEKQSALRRDGSNHRKMIVGQE